MNSHELAINFLRPCSLNGGATSHHNNLLCFDCHKNVYSLIEASYRTWLLAAQFANAIPTSRVLTNASVRRPPLTRERPQHRASAGVGAATRSTAQPPAVRIPYACQVIDFVLANLIGCTTVHLRPVLLVGKPGGKSRFALSGRPLQELAVAGGNARGLRPSSR